MWCDDHHKPWVGARWSLTPFIGDCKFDQRRPHKIPRGPRKYRRTVQVVISPTVVTQKVTRYKAVGDITQHLWALPEDYLSPTVDTSNNRLLYLARCSSRPQRQSARYQRPGSWAPTAAIRSSGPRLYAKLATGSPQLFADARHRSQLDLVTAWRCETSFRADSDLTGTSFDAGWVSMVCRNRRDKTRQEFIAYLQLNSWIAKYTVYRLLKYTINPFTADPVKALRFAILV